MTDDIDREQLRELCERATPGPWYHRNAFITDRYNQQLDWLADAPERGQHYKVIIGRSLIHGGADDYAFITAARTALPALLDLTDAQAAKIAELKTSLQQEHANAMNMARVQNEMYDAQANALETITAERDQLRKQVEGLRWEPISTAPETGEDLELLLRDGEISEARWNKERYCMLGSRAGSFPPGWSPTRSSGVDLNLPMTFDGNEPTHWRLAAASALEQQEQG